VERAEGDGRRVLAHRFSCDYEGDRFMPDSLPVGTPAMGRLRSMGSCGPCHAPVFANANAYGCDIALSHKPVAVVGPSGVVEWRFCSGERVTNRALDGSDEMPRHSLEAAFHALGGRRARDDLDAGLADDATAGGGLNDAEAAAKPPMCSCDFVLLPVNLEARSVCFVGP
jgi:hypothetical protein